MLYIWVILHALNLEFNLFVINSLFVLLHRRSEMCLAKHLPSLHGYYKLKQRHNWNHQIITKWFKIHLHIQFFTVSGHPFYHAVFFKFLLFAIIGTFLFVCHFFVLCFYFPFDFIVMICCFFFQMLSFICLILLMVYTDGEAPLICNFAPHSHRYFGIDDYCYLRHQFFLVVKIAAIAMHYYNWCM